MLRVQLPAEAVQQLEQAFRQATDRPLRDRPQAVLMAHRRRPHQDIAADLGVTPRAVQRWLNAYLDGRLPGLQPRNPKGATAKVPAGLTDEVRRWVIEGPAKQGLDRANRTHAELADHVLEVKGLRVSRAAVGRFCRKVGIRVYRPSYRDWRGDPDKQAQSGAEQAELKKGRRRAAWSC